MKNHILINPLLLEQEKTTLPINEQVDTSIFDIESDVGTEDLPVEVEPSGRELGPDKKTLKELGGIFSDAVLALDEKTAVAVMAEFGIRSKEGTEEQMEKAQLNIEKLKDADRDIVYKNGN